MGQRHIRVSIIKRRKIFYECSFKYGLDKFLRRTVCVHDDFTQFIHYFTQKKF